MKINSIPFLLLIFILVISACNKNNSTNSMQNMESEKNSNENTDFKKMCQDAGYEWMYMKPTQDGKIIQSSKSCWGCMIESIEHVCDMEKFMDLTGQK